MTSVTIPDEIRRKLKELAAKYDTTQGKIIEEALKIFEIEKGSELHPKINQNKNTRELLKQVSKEVRKENPALAKRRKKLEKLGISIDEIISYTWGTYDENYA